MNMKEMEAKIKALEKQVSLLDDVNQVKKLQRAYSYYVMRMMKNEIVDCFAEHPETGLYWLEGAYLGKEAVKRYFGVGGDTPPQPPEFFHQVMPIAGVVDVAPDGERAWGRWYTFGSHSLPAPGGKFRKSFVGGVYEIEYIKQNGVWKFLKINWQIPYSVNIPEENWRSPELIGEHIGHPQGSYVPPVADIAYDAEDPRFMSGYVIPFHYKHPVTGKKTSEDTVNNKSVISTIKARKKAKK
jgi:hypothetical protein